MVHRKIKIKNNTIKTAKKTTNQHRILLGTNVPPTHTTSNDLMVSTTIKFKISNIVTYHISSSLCSTI